MGSPSGISNPGPFRCLLFTHWGRRARQNVLCGGAFRISSSVRTGRSCGRFQFPFESQPMNPTADLTDSPAAAVADDSAPETALNPAQAAQAAQAQAQTRDRLLEAAGQVFAEKGF